MSIREQIQNELVDFLQSRNFNAPYGVLTGIKTARGGGKAREVTFGMAATLDATITIWSPTKFVVEARGPLSQYLDREYHDLASLRSALEQIS